MNKIYKVIWSKVKNQYVVVSELAHSNGKQSRTSRNSIRSRIAALVVCGAIAAFGVFSALPNSAYAVAGGVATQSQYIAIATDSNSDDTANYDGYNYYKKSVSINGQTKYYYVREGYDISVVYGKRYAGADNSSAYIIDAKKNDQYNQSSDQGLLQAYQTTTSKGKITTLTGVNIEDLNTGVYGGASNAGGVDTPSDFGYHIKVNNLDGVFTVDDDGYIKVSNDLDGRGDWTIDAGVPGNTNFETYFSDKVTLENDGTYSYTHGNEKVTVPTNKVYSIGGKLGVFTDAKGNLYTGDVYGDNNEILLSAVGEGNQIYSYWGTKVNDPTQTIGNMTVQDYNSDRKKLQDQAAAYHGDDITNIAVGGANNKGTISLNRVGIYDEQTGDYTSTTPVPGTITVTSTGGTDGSGANNDVKIKFSNTDEDGTEHSFTVDAGSKVVGKVTEDGREQDAGVDDANKTLTGLKINGVDYALSQGKTYDKGDGISIDETTNKISVALAEGQDKENVSGLHFKDGKLVNDLQVTNVDTATTSEPHNDGGNWTITKIDEKGTSVDLTNTTLSSNVSKEAIVDNVAGSGYGNTYTISDTDGNTATLEDVASADTLKTIDTTKIGNLQYNNAEGDSDETSIVKNNEDLTTAVGKLDNKVSGGWNAKVGTETITVTPKEDGNNTLEFAAGNNVSITPDVENNKITIATDLSDLRADETNAVLYDKDTNKTSVTLGGAKTYEKGKENTGVKLTNVAYANVNDESAGSDAVNVDLLKDYVDANGGGSWDLTTNKDSNNKTTVGKDSTVDFAGVTDGEHQNIHVTQETQYTDGKVTGTDVKFDLDNKLVLGDNDQITIDGSDGKATIKLGNITSGTATIGGIDIATTTTDGKTSSTIDGLTNNTWDNNNTNQYDDSKKAATEGQLYDALTGLSKEADVAVIHADKDGKKDANSNNLKDTKATIVNEAGSDERSSSIALGNGAKVSVQNGYKSQGILFGNETYTGGIAIGQEATALNGTVNIGVKDYKGQMGDVTISSNSSSGAGSNEAYNTYPASGTGETSVGSNSYISGMLSTNTGSYNIVSTKYMNTDPERILGRDVSSLYALQNTGAVVMGTLNSIESNTSKDNAISIATNIVFSGNDDSVSAKISGVANNVVGMANKTNNTNGSLIFGTGNEITNSLDDIPLPDSVIESIKNEILSNHGGTITQENASEIAEEFRKAVADRKNQNGGAVLAIGGGNKADYALNSQLIGVQNQITGTKDAASQYNMVNGYQNTVEYGSNDTVIGTKNTVTNGDSNIVLGDNHTVQNADNNVILGSSDKVATQTASNTVVIGYNAQANSNNDVAIGSGSVANGAVKTAGYAGANPIGTVSVGSEGNERTITNVAAGRINEDSTDAVNGSQLASVKDGAVKYWQNEDGSYDKSFVQLEGGEDGTLVTHVRDGAVNEYSSDAVNGSQLWETQQQIEEAQTEAGKHTTIQETGKNINVTKTETDGQLDYTINLNDDITLGNYTKGTGVVVSGSSGTISATNAISVGVDPNNEQKGIVISSGKSDSIVGLDNIEWKNDADWQKDNIQADRAATEGQLQQATSTLTTNERHIATNGGDNPEAPNNKYTVQANGTVSLTEVNGDGTPTKNTVVLDNVATKTQQDINTDKLTHIEHYAVDDEGNTEGKDYTQVEGTKLYNDGSISSTVKDGWGMSSDTLTFDESGLTVSKETMGNGSGSTNISGDTIKTVDEYGNETTIDGGSVTTEDLTVNTENGNKLTFDSTGLNVNSGDTGLSVNKDGISLSVDNGAGKNSSVKVTQDGTEFSYSENGIADATTTTIKGSTITTDTVTGLNNTTWDDELAKQVANSEELQGTAATQGQLQQAVSEVAEVANAGWTASDGTNSISVKPNETLTFVGNENLTVSADGTDKELKVSLNDDITLGDGENAIKIDGTDGTLNIGSTFAVAEDGTVLSDGDVIADADGEKYSLSEVGKYAVRYDKTNDGTSTITLVDGDDLSGTRIKNVADGVDPKDAVNVSQLEAVEATANAGWTASDGTNSISIKPNETLNFVGDENLTVSADGTDKKLKVSLNDNITLGDKESTSITLYTDPTSETTVVGTDGNTTNVTGYVPESYKSGTGADFVKNNGGFALFTTDTQGHGIFGVTTKGTAHGKDFVTYTKDIYGNDTRYSLNDVGDAVTQMSSYYNEENGKSYTVFSRYLNEAEKDNPFATVDENATRDIPLALRDDGAVLIGATIKGDDFTDNGIRINAETETTYDGDGNEVTNNIATITGLENTEWKPPTPVATFAANDINTTSRAATEAQLDDLYSAVAAYDVNVDGTIDYSHIALAGTPYGASRSGNGTHTGGTSITNVAYASGKDGSEAVNVDYLNDAISDAAENGSISTSDQHLVANTETGSNGVYKPNDDGNVNLIVSDEKGNSSTITIGDVASKEDLDNLKDDVGDLDYSKVEGDTIIDGDSVTDAIGKLDNKIDNITGTATDADNNTVTGGKINSDGTISLTQKDKDSIKLEGQLTDSGVVQEGTSFDKETGTITITSQDKYSGETSSVKVEGIASTEVVGATNKEDLATAYKDADKDGNATTEYITDSESMVEADVALDHAIQDVAGTSYANDMVLSNRIDSVEKRLGNVEERIDKVGAMAAAIANLRTMGFDPEAPTEIAIGVGQYKSETGIAIGVFHYPNQDFMLSASLSSSGDELMGGIGATWKLGRKSAAERVKDEEARHLEQAEEMKKLAQQEKVKAQAQRHAKLLAERQQASQKNA